jgi:hypothetical protein
VRKPEGAVLFEDVFVGSSTPVDGWATQQSVNGQFEVLVLPEESGWETRITRARIRLDRHPAAIQWAREIEQEELQSEMGDMTIQ